MASIVKATRKKGIVYVACWYDANHAQQTKTFPTKEAAAWASSVGVAGEVAV